MIRDCRSYSKSIVRTNVFITTALFADGREFGNHPPWTLPRVVRLENPHVPTADDDVRTLGGHLVIAV